MASKTTGTLNLISILIGLFGDFEPKLVHAISGLIHGNPRQAGETGVQYLIRINSLTDAALADADANAKAVMGS